MSLADRINWTWTAYLIPFTAGILLGRHSWRREKAAYAAGIAVERRRIDSALSQMLQEGQFSIERRGHEAFVGGARVGLAYALDEVRGVK